MKACPRCSESGPESRVASDFKKAFVQGRSARHVRIFNSDFGVSWMAQQFRVPLSLLNDWPVSVVARMKDDSKARR
jgi:hypothetical protein